MAPRTRANTNQAAKSVTRRGGGGSLAVRGGGERSPEVRSGGAQGALWGEGSREDMKSKMGRRWERTADMCKRLVMVSAGHVWEEKMHVRGAGLWGGAAGERAGRGERGEGRDLGEREGRQSKVEERKEV